MMVAKHNLSLLSLGLLVLNLVIPPLGQAQTAYDIIPEEPTYRFGETMKFEAELIPAEAVDEVLLFLQASENTDLQVHAMTLGGSGNLSVEIDLQEYPLQAFSEVGYWFQVTSADGEIYTSPRYSFTYLDNRYLWRMISGEPFTAHWYQGDLNFGKEVLNVSLEGLRKVQEILDIFFPNSIDIYVYEDAQTLQTALDPGGQAWVAGHANSQLGVIYLSLPPGPDQRLEMERQIPHELMHIALSYTDAHAYANLPVWFNEGLASLAELYPNPEDQALLESAYSAEVLLSLDSLCESFPNDPQGISLAYAQSASFTNYLYKKHGQPGFNRLMAAYASGMSCETGIEEALGMSLTDLENAWKKENFTGLAVAKSIEEYLPWLFLFVVVLLGPIILVVLAFRNKPERSEI